MIDPKLTETLLNIVEDPKKYGVPELNFLFWQLADEKVKQAYLDFCQSDPILRQFHEEGYLAPDYDFESLASLPEGTLGYTYYHHITKEGLIPNLGQSYRVRQEALDREGKLKDMPEAMKYSTIRGFQMHDIWHPLTGYDTSGLGEIKLQAFTLAQFHKPYNAFWMSILTTQMAFKYPQQIDAFMDAITEGWQLGKRAKSLILTHWEELFDYPLNDLRREYNLV